MSGMNEGITSGAFDRHEQVLQTTKALQPSIKQAAELLAASVRTGATIFTCGNGGSAADAQHLAAEFTCRYKDDRRPLAAVLLGANFSHLTAVGNDYAFEDIFA